MQYAHLNQTYPVGRKAKVFDPLMPRMGAETDLCWLAPMTKVAPSSTPHKLLQPKQQ